MKRKERARIIEMESRAQGIHPEIGPCPHPEEMARLGEVIRNWRPDYRIGDTVRMINPIGAAQIGVVEHFLWKGTHICVRVHHQGGKTVSEFAARNWVRA